MGWDSLQLMSSNKKGFLRTVFTSNGSCGCGKAKPFEVHEPIPKSKFSTHHNQNTNPSCMSSSTTTSGDCNGGVSSLENEEFTSAATSELDTTITHDHDHKNNNNNDNVVLKKSPLMDSVAIEKNSSDPYHDFRHSMLQMIFEKEIDSEEDLQDLLQCFLQLNAPRYHDVIVEVFNEICEDAFSDKVSSTAEPAASLSSGNNIIDGKAMKGMEIEYNARIK
ncbi:unnamed protein product [Lupinus luteus]|uniref:Transcription repressor n=1 Tax=Lupinus luteus TaxID=3873 RepID=A0AAV1W4A1_LUPLU